MSSVRISWQRRLLTLLLVPALVSVTAVSGCTYSKEEPGLFGRSPEPTTIAPSPVAPTSTAARSPVDLPVVASAVWTSGDGDDVRLRYAVHAVRRLDGATVLDWSITPLGGRGLRTGDALPPFLDLGLGLNSEELGVFLVDAFGGKVYRPLVAEAATGRRPACLCTLWPDAQRELRVGQTRLLQIAYPALPEDLATVDVDFQTVPLMYHVPVTGRGQVPRVANQVDLSAAADAPSVGGSTMVFRYGPRQQKFLLSVDAVLGSGTFTSVQWTIQSVTAGPGVGAASDPPIVDSALAARSVNPVAASGLRLRPVGGALQKALVMRVSIPGKNLVQCLCTDLRQWAGSLQRGGRQISVVTNLSPLPIGTQQVEVIWPGLTTLLADVVTAADGSTQSAGPVATKSRTWPRGQGWPTGWSVDDWPTPLPAATEVRRSTATIERLLP